MVILVLSESAACVDVVAPAALPAGVSADMIDFNNVYLAADAIIHKHPAAADAAAGRAMASCQQYRLLAIDVLQFLLRPGGSHFRIFALDCAGQQIDDDVFLLYFTRRPVPGTGMAVTAAEFGIGAEDL